MNGRLLKGLQIALLLILIFAVPEMAFAVEAGTGKISGRVLDERSGEGLAFANVLLTSLRDTTFARATISDIHGLYELSDIPQAIPNTGFVYGLKQSCQRIEDILFILYLCCNG